LVVIDEVNCSGDIFSSAEDLDDVFYVDISVGKVFRVMGRVERGNGRGSRSKRGSRHVIDSFY
jgi:hypothetical protein